MSIVKDLKALSDEDFTDLVLDLMAEAGTSALDDNITLREAMRRNALFLHMTEVATLFIAGKREKAKRYFAAVKF